MVQQISRIGLANYNFPLVSTGRGKSTILDSSLDVASVGSAGQRDPVNKPQLLYCENLLPTTEGYRSVLFTEIIPASTNPAGGVFEEVYHVASSDGTVGWFSPAGGTNQIWKGSTWQGTGAFAAGIETSHANITGQSYICWQFAGVKRVNLAANTLSENSDAGDTLVGISAVNIKGICASGNYLIAYSEQAISWSNPANPMDFVPSLITGAGTATPADLRGKIVTVVQTADGFNIYTTQNVVSARASGNTRYPFIFKHIAGSAGLRSSTDAVTDDISDTNIAWTVDGMQQVAATGVSSILPDITDFLASRLLETYDAVTGILTLTELAAPLNVALHRVSERYLVISYGVTAGSFTHALVYDNALKRWGKVVIAHSEVITLPSQDAVTSIDICFVASDGSVKKLTFTATDTAAAGVAIFGRITTTRTSRCTLQRVTIESPKSTDVLTCRVGTSYIGGVQQAPLVTLTPAAIGTLRNYPCLLTGEAHYVHLTGMLNLTCLEVTTVQGGVR